jgi:hypothetical protein
VQPRFFIEILPRKPQVVLDVRLGDDRPAEGQVGRLPDNGAGGVHHLSRRSQMIVQEPEPIPGHPHGHRLAVQVDVIPERIAARIGLADQESVGVVLEMSGFTVNHLLHAPMERVVGVFGDGRAADLDPDQPVALVADEVADPVGNDVDGAIEG